MILRIKYSILMDFEKEQKKGFGSGEFHAVLCCLLSCPLSPLGAFGFFYRFIVSLWFIVLSLYQHGNSGLFSVQ